MEQKHETLESDKSTYNRNAPTDESKPAHGIREEVAEKDPNKTGLEGSLDETRKEAAEGAPTHGGMGRTETPKDNAIEGSWEPSAEPESFDEQS